MPIPLLVSFRWSSMSSASRIKHWLLSNIVMSNWGIAMSPCYLLSEKKWSLTTKVIWNLFTDKLHILPVSWNVNPNYLAHCFLKRQEPLCQDLQLHGAKLVHGYKEFFLPYSKDNQLGIHKLFRNLHAIMGKVRALQVLRNSIFCLLMSLSIYWHFKNQKKFFRCILACLVKCVVKWKVIICWKKWI